MARACFPSVSQFPIWEMLFPLSALLFSRWKLCLIRYTEGNFNENPSMRALVKILRARASEHSCKFYEQFEQRPNFACTFKLDGTIRYPSVRKSQPQKIWANIQGSSRLSAREKERVRLAELKPERSLLNQRQALRAAEEDLDLELEIVKAETREKALNEMDKEHEVRLRHAVQVHHQLPYPLSQLCCRLFLRHYPMILHHPLKYSFLLLRHLILQRPRLRQVCRAQETL